MLIGGCIIYVLYYNTVTRSFIEFVQVANCLYYDATLTLGILQKLNVASEVFNLWFQMLQQVKKSGARVNFKRYIAVCISALGISSNFFSLSL